MSIVGYYHANERHDGTELGNTAKKNGNHIFRYFPRTAVLLLDNTKLAGLPKLKEWDPALQIVEYANKKEFTSMIVVHTNCREPELLRVLRSKLLIAVQKLKKGTMISGF
ncbi:hypothetical protein J5N97_020622 [Dioscorea zingiberensis]|uniref:Uncharacterized protein n=1 Tax=Dioscorea zingiberensis TaxID=325984 RepID=A0A9D5HDY1_9LILI|nr:hypothetical protein J5N97_020622 [Dioscorea zingiberensis]